MNFHPRFGADLAESSVMGDSVFLLGPINL